MKTANLRTSKAAIPRTFWWLSFRDNPMLEGAQHFRGVVVISVPAEQGTGLESAIKQAWAANINPGGEVTGIEITRDAYATLAVRGLTERILSMEDAQAARGLTLSMAHSAGGPAQALEMVGRG